MSPFWSGALSQHFFEFRHGCLLVSDEGANLIPSVIIFRLAFVNCDRLLISTWCCLTCQPRGFLSELAYFLLELAYFLPGLAYSLSELAYFLSETLVFPPLAAILMPPPDKHARLTHQPRSQHPTRPDLIRHQQPGPVEHLKRTCEGRAAPQRRAGEAFGNG